MTIIQENHVTLAALADHIEHSGLTVLKREEEFVFLRSETGVGFRIYLDTDRKFIRLSTYLPLEKSRTYLSKLELVQQFNRDLFLASFALDSDDDLLIIYYMSYAQGLHGGQFMKVLQRYSELLDHIIEKKNDDDMIAYPNPPDAEDVTSKAFSESGAPPNTLLN